MKYNAINLIRRGADALHADGDGGSAYALHELANNLILVMTGKDTIEEWNGCYVAHETDAIDIDKHLDSLPQPKNAAEDQGEDQFLF